MPIPRLRYSAARTVRLYRRLLQSCADPLRHRLYHPTAGRGQSRVTRCPLFRGKVKQLLGLLDQRDQPAAGCQPGAICRPPVGRSLPLLILDARYERVREPGVITSQAVLIAIGIDWDGRRQVLAVELANRESRSSW